MAKVVNLRQARKARERTARKAAADANAARHGRSKADKQRDAALAEIERLRLDGQRLERGDDDADD